MAHRRLALLALITAATGHAVSDAASPSYEVEELSDEMLRDNSLPTDTE